MQDKYMLKIIKIEFKVTNVYISFFTWLPGLKNQRRLFSAEEIQKMRQL